MNSAAPASVRGANPPRLIWRFTVAFHDTSSQPVIALRGFLLFVKPRKSTQRFRDLNSIPAARIRVVIHRNKSTAVRLRGRLPSKFGSSQVCARLTQIFADGENGQSNAFHVQRFSSSVFQNLHQPSSKTSHESAPVERTLQDSRHARVRARVPQRRRPGPTTRATPTMGPPRRRPLRRARPSRGQHPSPQRPK